MALLTLEKTRAKIEDLRTALVDNGDAVDHADGSTDISGTLGKVMFADEMLEDKIEELEELLWTINDQLFDHFSKDWNLEGNKLNVGSGMSVIIYYLTSAVGHPFEIHIGSREINNYISLYPAAQSSWPVSIKRRL